MCVSKVPAQCFPPRLFHTPLISKDLRQETWWKPNALPEPHAHLVTQLLFLIMLQRLLMLTSNFLRMTITLHQIKLHYLTPNEEVYLVNRWPPYPGEIWNVPLWILQVRSFLIALKSRVGSSGLTRIPASRLKGQFGLFEVGLHVSTVSVLHTEDRSLETCFLTT